MNQNRKKKVWIILGVSLGIGLLCVFFFWFLPAIFTRWVSTETIESFLEQRAGYRGMVFLALFQAAQVLSIFFPGAAVQIAGGLAYGTIRSFLICLTTFVLTNIAVFCIARYRNSRVTRTDAKVNRKLKKVLDWINSSDPLFMVMLAYMMPGIPNGFVPYAASHTKITARQFSVAVFLGSLIQIFIMCSIGSRIMSGDYAVSFFLVLAMLGLIFLLYRVKNRLVGIFEQYQKTKANGSVADKR